MFILNTFKALVLVAIFLTISSLAHAEDYFFKKTVGYWSIYGADFDNGTRCGLNTIIGKDSMFSIRIDEHANVTIAIFTMGDVFGEEFGEASFTFTKNQLDDTVVTANYQVEYDSEQNVSFVNIPIHPNFFELFTENNVMRVSIGKRWFALNLKNSRKASDILVDQCLKKIKNH